MTEYRKKIVGPIHVIGITLRTSNDDDRALKDIPPFWQKFCELPQPKGIGLPQSGDCFFFDAS